MKQGTGLASRDARLGRVRPENRGGSPNKWQLLNAVEEAREPLGLKATSLNILRAMVSFISGDRLSGDTDQTHICFASNTSLAKRAHVSIQTVERHIAKLVALGLLQRRSSGNGKRWARRDRNNQVVLATGLSLMPLIVRHAELVETGHSYREAMDRIAVVRDRCSLALATMKPLIEANEKLAELYRTARNTLRRKTPLDVLQNLFISLSETLNLRGKTPVIEGHKETNNNPISKSENKIEVSEDQIERSFTKLSAALRYAKSQSECFAKMDDQAMALDLGHAWDKIRQLGPTLSFMILGYLMEKGDGLRNPQAYAHTLVKGLKDETLPWQSLLRSKTVPRGNWTHTQPTLAP